MFIVPFLTHLIINHLIRNFRKELSCGICFDLLYLPLSLPCGHSFCTACLELLFVTDREANCPLGRCAITCKIDDLKPNITLQNIAHFFFPDEMNRREKETPPRQQRQQQLEEQDQHQEQRPHNARFFERARTYFRRPTRDVPTFQIPANVCTHCPVHHCP